MKPDRIKPDSIDLGFGNHVRARNRRAGAMALVITSFALVLSTAVAATAVTIGIAKAETIAAHVPDRP